MADATGTAARSLAIAFEAYGVHVGVSAGSAEVLDRVLAILPPGWRPSPRETVERHFALTTEEAGTYAITRDDELKTRGLDLDLALSMLDSEIRVFIGRKAPGYVFVHAGAAAHQGKVILLPGTSFAGKTTLVHALMDVGATYFSDEFAVLDENGLAHPYAKPLSIRDGGRAQTDHSAESLGGVAADEALPVGVIAITSYRPGAEWSPRRMSPGEGAMALLANAVPARERPAEVMRAASRAAEGAVIVESERGEAREVAPLLLAELERAGAG